MRLSREWERGKIRDLEWQFRHLKLPSASQRRDAMSKLPLGSRITPLSRSPAHSSVRLSPSAPRFVTDQLLQPLVRTIPVEALSQV